MNLESNLIRHVKLRALRALVAVSQEGSIARAAKVLALSQPAVSTTIAELEKGVGSRLLDRTNRGVELTLAGHALMLRAVTVLDELRVAEQEISSLSDPEAGEIRLVCGPAWAGGFVPYLLLDLARAFPRLRARLVEKPREDMLRTLQARQADLGILRIPSSPEGNDGKGITFVPLFEEHLFVVAGRRHPLAKRHRIDFSNLSRQNWIMPAGDTSAGDLVAAEFRRLGLTINEPAISTDSIPLRTALLQSGRYLTVLPGSMLAYSRTRLGLSVLPVNLSGASRTVGIGFLQQRTLAPQYRSFIECATEAASVMKDFEPNKAAGRFRPQIDEVRH